MKYKSDKSGWPVVLEDIDLCKVSQTEINQIGKLLATNVVVVAKNQSLSIDDEICVLEMFDDLYRFDVGNNPEDSPYKNCIVEDSNQRLVRVTGELDSSGNIGFAADNDGIGWHLDNVQSAYRRSLTWLYGVHGTVGSKTIYTNTLMAFQDLGEEIQTRLKPLTLDVNSKHYFPKIVQSNKFQIDGLYFPFRQFLSIKDMSAEENKELITLLTNHILQEKYMYTHDWNDGDVLIADQWFGIHKREYFSNMDKRLLHRAYINYPRDIE